MRFGVVTMGNETAASLGTAVPISPETFDELTQRWCDALSSERESFWTAADVAAYAIRSGTRKEQAQAKRVLASAGHCTTAYVGQLARLSMAYGKELHLPDVAMALYRACLQAARRTGRKPADVLEDALAKGWHIAEVAALGRKPTATVGLDAECTACGTHVRLRRPGDHGKCFGGLRIPCPVCVAIAWADKTHAEPPEILGGLT